MREPHPIIAQIAALREAAGLSHAAVGRRIHWCRRSVWSWEAGVRAPRLDAIDAYAALFGFRLAVGDSDGLIVDALRQLRRDAGLTQTDVAHELGCALTTVCHRETGRRGLTLAAATAYAGLFGLELRLAVPDAH